MLLRINAPDKFPLWDLWRLVIRFTFDKKSCAPNVQGVIEEQLLKWNRDYQIDMVRYKNEYGCFPEEGSVLHETANHLREMALWLVQEEQGKFMDSIETYKKHGIDYRLVEPQAVFFPECEKFRNYARGEEALKNNMEEFPEIYKPKGEMEIIE